MADAEKNFYELCKQLTNAEANDYKGFLLYKAYQSEKHGEDLLASYVTTKSKFDSIYAFLLTNSRIIEINAFSTMFIVSTKSFKYINKVTIEQEFDDKRIKDIIKDEGSPERIQLKMQFIDLRNDIEDIVWEKIEEKENVEQVLSFAKKLREIQTNQHEILKTIK